MGHAIHRNGSMYRMWSTYSDTYITEPMTRDQMKTWVRVDAILSLLEKIDRDTESRLVRADRWGSSGNSRDSDKWAQEICPQGSFHHQFVSSLILAKNCKVCGEPETDHAHTPECGVGVNVGFEGAVETLTDCRAQISAVRAAMAELESTLWGLESEIVSVVKNFVPNGTPSEGGASATLALGGWECPGSDSVKNPAGVCVYDTVKDSAHDFCLFCSEPEERK